MAQRKVYGRRQVESEGRTFTIELRPDGIFVRRKHCRCEWKLPLERLINHAQNQPELLWDDRRQPEMFSGQPKSPDSALPPIEKTDKNERETLQCDTRPVRDEALPNVGNDEAKVP